MSLNAFITRDHRAGAATGPLAGKSVAIKDNLSTDGMRTTCGSDMLSSYVPPYDATVVEAVLDAGGDIVGKTNMDEFGMGGTTETSAFGPTQNPIDEERVPGGSSGGSAAAVAAGEADVALGTDTGGSVRNPAAFCGVVGLKPTYGLVSRYGLVAYANSLEQVGPIAPTVGEAAELLDVIAGPDDHDATTQYGDAEDPHPATTTEYAAAVDEDISDMTIGIVRELLEQAADPVARQVESTLETLADAGASLVDVELDSLEHALAAYYVIAMSEASSNLARYDGVRYGVSGGFDGDWNEAFARSRNEGFGQEVIRRILLGTYALSEGYEGDYYEKAQDARAWVKRDFDEALSTADVLATPTMPILPPKLGERMDDPLTLYLMDANTVPVNLANLPALSVPAGRENGLPVGLQLIGPAFGESALIRAGSVVA